MAGRQATEAKLSAQATALDEVLLDLALEREGVITDVRWRCSCHSRESTSVGRKGVRGLAQMRLAAFQTRKSACWTSGP